LIVPLLTEDLWEYCMLLSMGDRMERKGSKIVCMWTLLGIFVFTVFASPNIEIVYDPEFDYEDYYWALSGWNFGGMSSGHVQTWRFGIAYLNVSNLTALDGLAAKFSRAVCLMDGSKRIL
jgi:hypothetical protein